MLELIFVAVVGFGFLTAWFNAKTRIGQMATVAMLALCVALGSIAYQQRAVVFAPFAAAASGAGPDPAAAQLLEASRRLSARCKEKPDMFLCVPPEESIAALERQQAEAEALVARTLASE